MSDSQPSFFALNKGKIFAAIILIAIIVGYFTIDIRFKEVEINTGYSLKARQNPYLALQMFVNRSAGLEDDDTQLLETYHGLGILDDLPSTEDTLVITSKRHTVSEAQNEQLQQWVNQGGHLVVRASRYINTTTQKSGDKIIDDAGISLYEYFENDTTAPTPLGVTVRPKQDDTSSEDEDDSQDVGQGKSDNQDEQNELVNEFTPESIAEVLSKMNNWETACEQNANVSSFPTESNYPDAYAHIQSPDFLISDDNDNLQFWSSDGYGPQIMQVNQGKGRLTVLTDADLWQNRNVHCHDNALFFQFVTNHQRPNAGKTWIMFHEDMPGVLELLWQHHRPLIFSSAFLLLAWLLIQSLRFGPIQSKTNIERRAFLEHLEAATRYRWQSGVHEQIIEQLRHHIINKVSQRHPLFEQKSEQEKAEIVARMSEQDSEQVHYALFTPISSNPQHNVQLVRVLQQIRKHL